MTTTTIPTPAVTPPPGRGDKPAPTATITIGQATAPDAPAVAALGAKVFTETFGHSVSKEDLEDFLSTTYSAEAIISDLGQPNKATLVARDASGAVVGIVQLHRNQSYSSIQVSAEEHAVLQKLYVDSNVHGQGIGSKLTAAVEEQARQEGFKHLWLTVWEENFKAQKLYQRLGYTHSVDTEFLTGTCIQTDWVMTKAL
jgi:diamine N-acetyltransferase